MCCPGEGAELTAAAEASQSSPPPFKIKSLVNFKINCFFFRVEVRNKFSSLLGKSQWKKTTWLWPDFSRRFGVKLRRKKEKRGRLGFSRINPIFFLKRSLKVFKVLNPFFFRFRDTNPRPSVLIFFFQTRPEYPAKEDRLLVSTLCAKKEESLVS